MINDPQQFDPMPPTVQVGETLLDPAVYGQVGTPAAAMRTELLGADQAAPVSAWLVFTGQGPRFGEMVRIAGKSCLIGRANDCDVVLEDGAASRQHTKIRVEGPDDAPRYVVHDLATDNGTFVNGTRQASAELKNNDVLQIGRTELTFKRI